MARYKLTHKDVEGTEAIVTVETEGLSEDDKARVVGKTFFDFFHAVRTSGGGQVYELEDGE